MANRYVALRNAVPKRKPAVNNNEPKRWVEDGGRYFPIYEDSLGYEYLGSPTATPPKKEQEEPDRWVTVKGKHIPIYKDAQGNDVFGVGQEQPPKQKSSMNASEFKLEQKKWSEREKRNFNDAVNFMSENFGDIKDLIGTVYRRAGNWSGLYDRDGLEGRGRATYFHTSNYANTELILHEFTHSITEEIAEHYKQFGFNSRDELLRAMRSQVYRNMNKQEPAWNNKNWSHRPSEFFSRQMEAFAPDEHTRQPRKHSEMYHEEVLKVIKEYYAKLGRG